MTPNDPRRPGRSDGDLDTLLTDFFAREMPAELRDLSDVETSPHSHPRLAAINDRGSSLIETRSASRSTAAALWRPAALALAVLLAVVVFRGGPTGVRPTPPETASAELGATSSREKSENTAATGSREVDYSVTERLEPVERFTYETGTGPVEQRTDVRVTNVSVFEPASGAKVEVELEELNIEIIPIED